MESFFIKRKNVIKPYIGIVAGTLLMAISVVLYFDAAEVVVGGVTGIAIILKQMFNIPMWIVNAAINVPLFILSYKALEREMFVRTLVAAIFLTVFLGIIPEWNILTGDLLVDIIMGSVFMGAGLGMIFAVYASSGGTDLMATLINLKVRYISIPKIMAIIDGIIVIAGAGVFGISSGIYSLIAIYIVTKVSDAIIEGPNRAKLLYVISEYHQELTDYIVNTMDRGATYINTTGVFTGKSQKMVMCVVSSKEMVKIKQMVYHMDERAICFVGDIREAFGEGFTKFRG